MVLLVFVHGYNLHIRYLQPWTLPGEPLTGTSFLEYFLANGLLRFRIPMLFIISGFLYALHDYRPYRSFTWKRFKTLIIPYLIWSALGLAFTYGLELTHYGRGIIAGSGVVQIDDQRMLLHDYHWYEMLGRWILLPVPYQLWFIRVLFIYNLAYPLIRWCVLHRIVRWIFFTVAVVMWLGTMSFILVEGEGLLFFSLGVWIRKTQFNIESPGRRWRPLWWGIAFAGIAGVKTILAFKGQPVMGNSVYFVLLILHKLMVLSGLIFCWFGLDRWVTWCMSKKWFIWLSAFAFMIYAMHAPLVAYAINPVLGWFHYLPATRLISYFLLPLAVISLCIVTGEILRRLLPGIYTHLTGGRGVVKK
ncbi:MAG TPA: acyltransferase [Bacteroidales bacterium]|nr:acyltransferase [Bacteroidales bacterium]